MLTPKQQRFVEEYLIDLNAAGAYRRAGYKANTDHAASVNASKLMAKHGISLAIEQAQLQLSERTQLTVDWIASRLKREADYRGEGASHSARVSALSWLGKHLAMFQDRLDLRNVSDTDIDADIRAILAIRSSALPGTYDADSAFDNAGNDLLPSGDDPGPVANGTTSNGNGKHTPPV